MLAVVRRPLRLALGLLLVALPGLMTSNPAHSGATPSSATQTSANPTRPAGGNPKGANPIGTSPMGASPTGDSQAPAPSWLSHPGRSFWDSRPWVYGWYRVDPAVWSWWSTRPAGWGLASLAPAATITALVQASLTSGSSVIVVPGSAEQLDLASLQPLRPMGVRFRYASAANAWIAGSADCQAGLLAGQPPQTPLEAQRLHAVCQVTYGNP